MRLGHLGETLRDQSGHSFVLIRNGTEASQMVA